MKDITDPMSGLFIDDKLNSNEQNLQNTTDNFFLTAQNINLFR